MKDVSMARVLAVLALGAWCCIFWSYPVTVFLAGSISCLTLPLYRWLRARMSRFKSTAIYAAGLSLCLILPFTIVTVLITPQAVSGIRRLNAWRASGWAISPELTEYLDEVRLWLSKVPGLSEWIDQIGENFDAYVNSGLKTLVSGGIGLAGGTMTAIWLMCLFIVLATLGVIYAPAIRRMSLRVTRLPEDSFNRILLALRHAFRSVFIGILFVAVMQGTLTGIGLRIVGVSDPAFWGLLATFAAVIPVVGTALVWGPLSVVLWFTVSPGAAVGLAAWGTVVVAGSDNLVRPYLLKTGIEAPMFVLLFSILCSMALRGPVGLVAGPVLVAFAVQAFKESDRLQMRRQAGNI